MPLGPVIFSIKKPTLDAEAVEMLKHPACGGIILFQEQDLEREALCAFIAAARAIRPELLITVDQEGGRVQRLQKAFTRLPALGCLTEQYDHNPEAAGTLARKLGWLMASELKATDIDMSFAPVVDCPRFDNPIMGDRTLHTCPKAIADLAQNYIAGMNSAGMPACLKHFPGHGGVALDSHKTLPVDTRALETILEDAYPFRVLANNQTAMMTAHIVFEQFDNLPVSFSGKWIQMVRETWKYNGCIISDDLNMDATKVIGDIKARTQAALQAGSDIVLVCQEPEDMPLALEAAEPFVSLEIPQIRRASLRNNATHSIAWLDLQQQADYQNLQAQLQSLS